MESSKYYISGISCQHCVGNVRNILEGIPGVTHISIDKELGLLTLEADKIPDIKDMNQLLGESGHYHLTAQK